MQAIAQGVELCGSHFTYLPLEGVLSDPLRNVSLSPLVIHRDDQCVARPLYLHLLSYERCSWLTQPIKQSP